MPPDTTGPVRARADPTTGRALPERIGHYRVVARLGEGGMGVVFEAEQESPRRTVALKVLATGLFSADAARRFAREAELLGRLQHPGIAQVFEAGTFESELGPQPFFAMELVRGVPLTRYAATHGLTARQRLELVARVADAVQHAHERGVVHRDLKPANVLVEANGQPRVLDFGIARAAGGTDGAQTLRTQTGQLLGTLHYMSPEQAAGKSVDARSDVYALGVLLYELLSGAMPYDLPLVEGTLDVLAALRIVGEREPQPLARVRPELAGDVEAIVATALEKEPGRRYASAAALAADLRRFLADEPIEARPASTLYRLRKFARRNRALVLGLAGVFLALVVGLVGTSLGFLEARRQRDEALAAQAEAAAQEERARQQAARAERTTRFLKELLSGIDPAFARGADTTLLRLILEETEARLATDLADLPAAQAEIRNTLGLTYSAIGAYERGLEHVRAALAWRERELGPDARDTIESLANVGAVLGQLSRFAEAEAAQREALARARRVLGPESAEALNGENLLATVLYETGRVSEACELASHALAGERRRLGDDHAHTLYTMVTVSSALLSLYRLDEAQALLEELLERSGRVRGSDHPQTLKVLSNLSGLALLRGDTDGAIASQQEACARSARVNGPTHPLTLELRSVLAGRLLHAGRWEEAETLLRTNLDDCRRTLGEDDRLTLQARSGLQGVLRESGRSAEAVAQAEAALASWRRLVGDGSPALRGPLVQLALAYLTAGERGRARATLTEALGALLDAPPDARTPAPAPDELATLEEGLTTLGSIELGEGRLDEARRAYERALALALAHPSRGDRTLGNVQSGLALVAMGQGRLDEAQALLRSSIAIQTERLGARHADTLTSHFNLAACLRQAGRLDEALREALGAAEGWSALGGDRHPSATRVREVLLEIFDDVDEPALEEPWRRKALALARASLAPDDPALGLALCALARTRLAQGARDEARALLEEATLALGALPYADWRVAWCDVLLGACLAAEGEAQTAAALCEGALERLRGAPEAVLRRARALLAADGPGAAGGR